jgi:hypothetical protein
VEVAQTFQVVVNKSSKRLLLLLTLAVVQRFQNLLLLHPLLR